MASPYEQKGAVFIYGIYAVYRKIHKRLCQDSEAIDRVREREESLEVD